MTDTSMKQVPVFRAHGAFRADLVALLERHAGDLPADHMLAIAAHTVGQIAALQDQRRYTSKMVMAIVVENLRAGNESVIEDIFNTKGEA